MPARVSIITVADAAGVSTATVSQALRGIGRMSDETRQHVLAVAEQLGYRPNALAQRFVRQRADAIGFLLDGEPDQAFHNPFWFEIINGAHAVCAEHDMTLVLLHPAMVAQKGGFDVLFQEKRIDGLLFPDTPEHADWRRTAMKSSCPFVALGQPQVPSPHNWVDIDNQAAGRFMYHQIAARGYRRPVFISGPADIGIGTDRWRGFQAAARASRPGTLGARLCAAASTTNAARETTVSALQAEPDCDVIVTSHNIIAQGALQAAQQLGHRVPEDLGLITFDSYPLAAHSDPRVAAVDMDMYGLGSNAVRVLLEILHRPDGHWPVQHMLHLYRMQDGESLPHR
ncbi:LacI family DNA-binding transcriptional regulator [Spirochaeta africana]|uniref:Transcriptional regulator n=1 Tax=Spirochaeta africana (strain ATCC 700263 / DSM 8902 / Z-7692) TaxID=889378 RepID=H9ULQ6_SPIAZ|nr:LacI family DNA-binding transcriptional regulator [Spirochaeta africana]AFG38449.1 transcriptional regulator [Spirochaeta africana DSM 8902]